MVYGKVLKGRLKKEGNETVTKCYQLKKKNMSKEAIIKAFEGVNVRIVWDDEKQEYFFSVNDIVEVLTESTDVKQYPAYRAKHSFAQGRAAQAVAGRVGQKRNFIRQSLRLHITIPRT